jgi:hypothetical protein
MDKKVDELQVPQDSKPKSACNRIDTIAWIYCTGRCAPGSTGQ